MAHPRSDLHQCISIHAPREGGDGYQYADLRLDVISIHAPREGGDYVVAPGSFLFLISIHAPREGGDVLEVRYEVITYLDFNPRPPRGGRQYRRKNR